MANQYTKIKTPQYVKATFKKEKRIEIPQSPDKLTFVARKDVITWENTRTADPIVLHRRGTHREYLGGDPLEGRAVSKATRRGTKPERILISWLLKAGHMVEGFDFTFQSSQEGGRMEMGGAVVDFLFPYLKMIIQVDGPTHDQFLRHAKDEEQENWLADLGYTVYHITMEEIYDEYGFEEKMRKLFGMSHGYSGTSPTVFVPDVAEDVSSPNLMLPLISLATDINNTLSSWSRYAN